LTFSKDGYISEIEIIYRFMKTAFFIIAALCCAFFATAQISLVPFDEAGKSGIKSILFDNSNEKGQNDSSKKSFDIQANNPYNNLPYVVTGHRPNGSDIFEIKPNEKKSALLGFGMSAQDAATQASYSDAPITGSSNWYHNINGSFVTIAYNLSLYKSQYDLVENGRFSTIYVLNQYGEKIHELTQIPTDVYDIAITGDGEHLMYAYGEYIEDLTGDIKGGFKIIRLSDRSIFYEREVYRIKGFFSMSGQVVVNSIAAEGHYLYILDESNDHLYKYEKTQISMSLGGLKFISIRRDTLTTKDLIFVK
jgi:hypothetical protein